MPKKLTTEEFIIRAKKVHGERFDYSTTNYINSDTQLAIICPQHGEFHQLPRDHLFTKGCKKCTMGEVWDTESFIKKATSTHNGYYTYANTKYTNSDTKVIITCNIHGDFSQTPKAHVSSKQGCPKCGTSRTAKGQQYDTSIFIKKAIEIHGDKYDYSKVNYTNHVTPVTIICSKHGEFLQKPSYHLGGSNCQECAKILAQLQFNPIKPTTLYFVYFPDFDVYKVGITNRSVKERFGTQPKLKVTILQEHLYPTGYDAWKVEQKIIKDNLQYKYDGPPILYAGNSELFTCNVLSLKET